GRITISDPLAIVANGSRILALGQVSGANVGITSNYFIRSSDRANVLAVDGTLVLDAQVQDVSSGAQIPDVSFLDASRVLRGQCREERLTGETSRLSVIASGPYMPLTTGKVGQFAAASAPSRCLF